MNVHIVTAFGSVSMLSELDFLIFRVFSYIVKKQLQNDYSKK